MGPNLTLPMLTLSWSRPAGESLGFEIKLVSKELENNLTTTTTNLNYNFTGLKQYNKQYSAMLWTLGCGKNSAVKEISCMTGFTSKESYTCFVFCFYMCAYHLFLVFLCL